MSDLYVDKFKFQVSPFLFGSPRRRSRVPGSLTAQGINVKGRMGMLAELLDRCGEQELLDFFSA